MVNVEFQQTMRQGLTASASASAWHAAATCAIVAFQYSTSSVKYSVVTLCLLAFVRQVTSLNRPASRNAICKPVEDNHPSGLLGLGLFGRRQLGRFLRTKADSPQASQFSRVLFASAASDSSGELQQRFSIRA